MKKRPITLTGLVLIILLLGAWFFPKPLYDKEESQSSRDLLGCMGFEHEYLGDVTCVGVPLQKSTPQSSTWAAMWSLLKRSLVGYDTIFLEEEFLVYPGEVRELADTDLKFKFFGFTYGSCPLEGPCFGTLGPFLEFEFLDSSGSVFDHDGYFIVQTVSIESYEAQEVVLRIISQLSHCNSLQEGSQNGCLYWAADKSGNTELCMHIQENDSLKQECQSLSN